MHPDSYGEKSVFKVADKREYRKAEGTVLPDVFAMDRFF